VEIRDLTFDDLEAVKDLRVRAFGYKTAGEWELWKALVAPSFQRGRFLGGFDGDRMVSTVRILEMGQWWHGRRVAMGGVSGVAVAPEDRGRGAGREIMMATLERCAELGYPLSVLFPATTPLYRSLGWEHVGARHHITLDAETLRTVAGEPVKVRRATAEDAEDVVAVVARAHEANRSDGPFDWGVESLRPLLADPEAFNYLAEDGFLRYRWIEGNQRLLVEAVVAVSERTARGLWGIVGSSSSVVASVVASVDPHDPVFWLARERSLSEELVRRVWMLRLVDARAAIGERGFPAGLSAEVPLAVEDRQRAVNTGHWRLSVAGSRGVLEPAPESDAAVRLGAGALAALYGGTPASVLRRAGLLTGPGVHDEILDTCFAARPFSIDGF
jgi:predicted acetyltransferase